MSNSGSDGRAGGFGRGPVGGDFLHSGSRLFEDDHVSADLHELERLVNKYPIETRRFLDGLPSDSPGGSGSPP